MENNEGGPIELINTSTEVDTSSQGAHTMSQTDSALQDSDRQSDTDNSFNNTRDDSSSQRGSEDGGEEGRQIRLTRRWLDQFFRKEWKMYYRTIELNEKLYLHYKGFARLENMDLFPDLKCLYFEGNGIERIESLDTNHKLMSLML